MRGMLFEFEYFWAILLLFIMERICCLQQQFDQDLNKLPDSQQSTESFNSNFEEITNQE